MDTLYTLKVDNTFIIYIDLSNSTTGIERALKMDSLESSFTLFIDIKDGYVELAILRLNLYMGTRVFLKMKNIFL